MGDGWDLLQTLHPTPHAVPIIALLGLENTQQQRAQALGACIVLSNPVDRESLLAGATAVLDNV
jgi:CheY-like chemotaxis protein